LANIILPGQMLVLCRSAH